MIERLEEDGRVVTAARIGSYFRIDPMTVLQADYFDWATRVAAFNVAVTEENQRNEEARARAKRSKH